MGVAQIGLYVLQVGVHGRTGARRSKLAKTRQTFAHNLLAKRPDAPVMRTRRTKLAPSLPLMTSRYSVRAGLVNSTEIRSGWHHESDKISHQDASSHRGDFFWIMLPSIVRMIPVEIDHVVGFVIERLVPEALQKIVVEQASGHRGCRPECQEPESAFPSVIETLRRDSSRPSSVIPSHAA